MDSQIEHTGPTPPALASTRIAVITASVRDERVGGAVADWVAASLKRIAGVEVDVLDLADIALPDDRLLIPGGGPLTEVGHRIEAAQAFVFVTPEYNNSYPASLKRLLDWHYSEWQHKAATIVGYGGQGGHGAIGHLRDVLDGLAVVTTRRTPGLAAPWESLDADGRFRPDERASAALESALADLHRWARVLGAARAELAVRA